MGRRAILMGVLVCGLGAGCVGLTVTETSEMELVGYYDASIVSRSADSIIAELQREPDGVIVALLDWDVVSEKGVVYIQDEVTTATVPIMPKADLAGDLEEVLLEQLRSTYLSRRELADDLR